MASRDIRSDPRLERISQAIALLCALDTDPECCLPSSRERLPLSKCHRNSCRYGYRKCIQQGRGNATSEQGGFSSSEFAPFHNHDPASWHSIRKPFPYPTGCPRRTRSIALWKRNSNRRESQARIRGTFNSSTSGIAQSPVIAIISMVWIMARKPAWVPSSPVMRAPVAAVPSL